MKAKHPGRPTSIWMITIALAVAFALAISAPAQATDPCEDPNGTPHVLAPSPAVTTAALESWIQALPDGTIGCLAAGSYGNGSAVNLDDDRGNNTDRVKIRTRPSDVANGNYATIHARLTFGENAGFYTYRLLYVDSSGQSGLGAETINVSPGAEAIYIVDANITNGGSDTAACVSPSGSNFILQRSIIHDCGDPTAGSNANLDQCVYVSGPSGPPWGNDRGAVITHNLIYKCAANGVTVYPNGDEAKVSYNVIDRSGFGVQIGGDLVGSTCQAPYLVDASNNTNTNMTGVHNSTYDNATAAASEYWGCSGYGIFDYYVNNCHYNNAHAEYDFRHVSAYGNIEVASNPYTSWPHVASGSGCYAMTGDPVSEIIIPLPTSP